MNDPATTSAACHVRLEFPAPPTLDEIEAAWIARTMKRLGGDKRAAARELGISLKTLYNKLNRADAARKAAEMAAQAEVVDALTRVSRLGGGR